LRRPTHEITTIGEIADVIADGTSTDTMIVIAITRATEDTVIIVMGNTGAGGTILLMTIGIDSKFRSSEVQKFQKGFRNAVSKIEPKSQLSV
jgi:hypothetical protein